MSKPEVTVEEYIKAILAERQEAFNKLRTIINDNLPEGLEECVDYNMLAWVVPYTVYPNGYHCKPKKPLPFLNLANQKNFIALYHMGVYAKQELYDWFVGEYPNHAKYKLDMGKSCIRFKKTEDIPYNLIAQLIQKMEVSEWISIYEKNVKT
ncbi:MAG: DUF1801 domain-containing protein [Flavobacteriales bacterium]|nr:DUF1801 domain-containing protein [Flavobacteriales bacterium]